MRIRIRAAGVLAATAAALAALTASPALGGAPAAALDCNAAFDSLNALTSSVAARSAGDTRTEGDTGSLMTEVPASQQGKGGKNFRATVPTWIHVITDGATGNVTDEQIRQQMWVFNAGFAGLEGGAKTGFQFDLVGVTRTDNAAWYSAKIGTNGERAFKQTLRRGGAETLNVYVNAGGGALGYAYYPGDYRERPYIDGIVLDWETLPGGSYGSNFSLGKTLTHEAGHWLNLAHTFDKGCSNYGDYVDDTPAQKSPTSGCPIGRDSCTNDPGLDPIHNYMDYSFDSCYFEFTPGQAARMQDAWLFFRAGT
jgi:Pregnancy-associated plasma protein-A